ncbi:hypothetical protein [Peribacillus sp. Hz7]|uniref:hypothetical protein n=1 Tax=Peribacillus sp. Hz7 TaxID=3344873 RepID=UPI0035C95368
MIKTILYWIFPFAEMVIANRKITKKVEEFKGNLENDETYLSPYMQSFENIPVEEAEKIFNSILSNRKTLEDKAKVNVLIVTIAVTVILGLSSFLFTVQGKIPDNIVFSIFLIFLFILSLVYLTIGSIISLATLNSGESKEIYNLSPSDYQYLASISDETERTKEIRYFYSQYAELNMTINWKINNYVSCTYANIRNSLIFLGIIGIVFCSMFIFGKNDEQIKLEKELNKHVQLLESIEQDLSKLQSETKGTSEQYNDQIVKQQEILNQIQTLQKALKDTHKVD